MPALLMRTSSVSTSSTARWICEALVTSSVRGVTRLSECCSALRVPAYTLFAPRLSASVTSARPIPRLAPVIKTVLFAMFIPFSFPKFVLLCGITGLGQRKIRGLDSSGDFVGSVERYICPQSVDQFGDFYERVVEDVFPKHAAYCEAHARQFADKVRIALPPAKDSVSRRPYRATA